MSAMFEPLDYRGTTVVPTDGEVLMVAGDRFNEILLWNAGLGEKVMGRLNDMIVQRRPFFNVALSLFLEQNEQLKAECPFSNRHIFLYYQEISLNATCFISDLFVGF